MSQNQKKTVMIIEKEYNDEQAIAENVSASLIGSGNYNTLTVVDRNVSRLAACKPDIVLLSESSEYSVEEISGIFGNSVICVYVSDGVRGLLPRRVPVAQKEIAYFKIDMHYVFYDPVGLVDKILSIGRSVPA